MSTKDIISLVTTGTCEVCSTKPKTETSTVTQSSELTANATTVAVIEAVNCEEYPHHNEGIEQIRNIMEQQVVTSPTDTPIYINRERMQAALDGEFFTAPIGLDRKGIRNFLLAAAKSS